MRRHADGSYDDELLVREGGVFVAAADGREVFPDVRDRPYSDYPEDPIEDEFVPGTPDDIPYDYGIVIAEAADHIIDAPDGKG